VALLVLRKASLALAVASIVVNTESVGILAVLATRMFFRPIGKATAPATLDAARVISAMINNLLSALFFKVDVTLLKPLQGDTPVGWYNQAYKWVDALNVIPAYFTFALFPVLARQPPRQRRCPPLVSTWRSNCS